MKRFILIIILFLCSYSSGAEFLIYNTEHWMDKLDSKQIEEYCKKYPNFMVKYNSRYQRGDIVEIHEDGFWGDGPYPRKDIFRVVRVQGLSLKDAQQYNVADEVHRSRYSIISGTDKDVETVGIMTLQVIDKTEVIGNENTDIIIIIAGMLILGMAG